MSIDQGEIRKKLLAILKGPPKLSKRDLAKKLKFTEPRLNHFLCGRDHADRTTSNTTLRQMGLESVLQYLSTDHNWPPLFDVEQAYQKLLSVASREKPRSRREDFSIRLREGFIVTSISRHEIEAEDADDTTIRYRSKGGLTQEDLEAFRPFLEPEQIEEFMEMLAAIEAEKG
jgi:hypothetical protein